MGGVRKIKWSGVFVSRQDRDSRPLYVSPRAQLNEERRQLREQMSARLTRLADEAATAVEHNLDDDKGGVAISLLTGLGLLTREPPSIGSGQPAELKAELEEEERWRQFKRAPR